MPPGATVFTGGNAQIACELRAWSGPQQQTGVRQIGARPKCRRRPDTENRDRKGTLSVHAMSLAEMTVASPPVGPVGERTFS